MDGKITHLVVTGGAGYIGSRLARVAARHKMQVALLGRSGGNLTPWQLGQPLPALTIPWQSTAVIHLAHDWKDREERGTNYRGTEALLKSFREAGGKRFVFVSSQSARPDAENAYGRIKWNIEQALEDPHTVSARVGLVYGGSGRGLFGLMLKLVRLTPILPMIEPDRLVQPIHVDEVCEGLIRLAQSSIAGWSGIAPPTPITFRAFLKTLAREVWIRNVHMIRIPLGPLLLAFNITAKFSIKLPVDKERVLGLAGIRVLDCAADMQALGLEIMSVEQGLRADRWGRRTMLREGKILCTYVLGQKPSFSVLKRYTRAVWPLFLTRGPVTLPSLSIKMPMLLRFFEPVGAQSELGFRIRMAAALTENTPEGARQFHKPFGFITAMKLGVSLLSDAVMFPFRLVLGRQL